MPTTTYNNSYGGRISGGACTCDRHSINTGTRDNIGDRIRAPQEVQPQATAAGGKSKMEHPSSCTSPDNRPEYQVMTNLDNVLRAVPSGYIDDPQIQELIDDVTHKGITGEIPNEMLVWLYEMAKLYLTHKSPESVEGLRQYVEQLPKSPVNPDPDRNPENRDIPPPSDNFKIPWRAWLNKAKKGISGLANKAKSLFTSTKRAARQALDLDPSPEEEIPESSDRERPVETPGEEAENIVNEIRRDEEVVEPIQPAKEYVPPTNPGHYKPLGDTLNWGVVRAYGGNPEAKGAPPIPIKGHGDRGIGTLVVYSDKQGEYTASFLDARTEPGQPSLADIKKKLSAMKPTEVTYERTPHLTYSETFLLNQTSDRRDFYVMMNVTPVNPKGSWVIHTNGTAQYKGPLAFTGQLLELYSEARLDSSPSFMAYVTIKIPNGKYQVTIVIWTPDDGTHLKALMTKTKQHIQTFSSLLSDWTV